MPDERFYDDDFCFACGTKNPLGLHLKFFEDGELFCTRVQPSPHWQGFSGVMHGGLQATVFDDLMANHLFRVKQVWQATVEISLRFRQPAPTDRQLMFSSRIAEHCGRIWRLEGTCRLADDAASAVLTTASGRFMEVSRPA